MKNSFEPINGIIVIDKPKNYTSFDTAAVIRGLSHQKKVGHTGTLDPLATGVLPVLLGCAVKAQDILPESNKGYEADFVLGMTTDTLDITGKVLSTAESHVTEENIRKILNNFKGKQLQIPPMYSAVRKNGKRLYDLARQGITVEREPREIYIEKLELIDFDELNQRGRINVMCSKGTYIRSLIDDIGKCLGCGGTMTALRRTFACGYGLGDSVPLEKLRSLCENQNDESRINILKAFIRSTESIFTQYREIFVSEAQSRRFRNGGQLDIDRTSLSGSCNNNEIIRVKAPDKSFLGLAITDTEKNVLKIYKLFL